MSSTPSSRARRRCDRSLVQIVAGSRAGVQVDDDGDRPAGQVDALARSSPIAPPRQTQTPLIATSTWSALERGVGGADRGQHPAPVGVVAEQRGLEQVVAGARPADVDRVVLAGGVRTVDRDVLGRRPRRRPAAAREVGGRGGDRGGELLGGRGDAGGAAGQQQHGVVGGHAAVGVDPVEGHAGRRPQRRVAAPSVGTTASVVSTTSMVARPGASMPAPLAIPPTVQPSPLLHGRLRHGVGGHDRLGGVRPAVLAQSRAAARRRRQQLVHRQPHADQPGRADRDVARADAPSRAAACSAVAWVSAKPSGPVQALAPPELSTTARSRARRRAPAGSRAPARPGPGCW